MSLPAAVEQVLQDNNIDFQITETPVFSGHLAPITEYLNWAGATRSVLLTDGSQHLQAIIPANRLLDLGALEKVTGKQWRATPNQDVARVAANHSLYSLPALPSLTGLQTIVDEAVLEQPEVVIESGADAGLLRLNGQDFQQLLAQCTTAQITAALTPMPDPSQDDNDIRQAVANFTTKRMQQRLEDTLEFPPLPDTAQRIIRLRVDPNADIKDLADIVEIDPSLSAQVVSWAASPYYAAPGKIKSVHDAIIRVLGFDLVMNLALGLALGKTLKMPGDQPAGFTSYWHQAVYAAATVEELVKVMPAEKRPGMGMACLGGLLHNFGYLVLAEVFPPYFSSICRYVEANPHLGHSAIERHLIECDREQLASWLMNFWSMPDEVCTALRHQNNPYYDGPLCEYANLLYLTSRLLRQKGVGDCALENVPEAIYERLGLEPETAEMAVNKVLNCAEEINAMADDMARTGG